MNKQAIKGIYFSKRELEIIACLCSGCSTKIISKILKISIPSINSYIQRVMLKMNCYSKWDIVKFVENSDSYDLVRNIYIEIRLDVESFNDKRDSENFVKNESEVRFILTFFENPKKLLIIAVVTLCCIGCVSLFFIEKKCISFELSTINEQIFLPREKITEEINKIFSGDGNLKFVVLLGEGGIGKTSIARSYLSRSKFLIKAEIDAESEFKIVEAFENLLFLLCQHDRDYKVLQMVKGIKDFDEKRKKLKVILAKLLSKYGNWCLLYDNVEDIGLLKQWIPCDDNLFKNGRIIITTRNENIKNLVVQGTVNLIKMEHLSYEESEKLFYKVANWPNRKSIYDKNLIKYLLEIIPATPLDIVSAANFIRINNVTLEEYLTLIKKKGEKRMTHKIVNEYSDYSKTRESIVATTFDKILQVSDQNFELLTMLCLLDSQNIDKKIFQTIAQSEDVEAFFCELKKYSILEKNERSFSIHRLNQELGFGYLLEHFSEETLKNCLTKVVDGIALYKQIVWTWSKSEKKLPKDEARLLIPHLEAALAKLEEHKYLENYAEYKIKILTALYFAYDGGISYQDLYKKGSALIMLNSEHNILKGLDLILLLLHQVYIGVYGGEISDIRKNAMKVISICEKTENTDYLKMVAMVYLARYYFEFEPNYEKAKNLLEDIFEFKKIISYEDWDIVMCVFANQVYRSYESYYINDKRKMLEAIGYLKEALKAKGFTENYRKDKAKEIPIDKTVFIMYAIEMMINVSRAYNLIGDYDTAYENELDIKYIYDLLEKQGIKFSSQEFQFNTVYGETLLRKGMTKEASKVLSETLGSESISSKIDLFFGYVSKAEVDIALGKYKEALKNCDSALKITNQHSNCFLFKKCKCLYLKLVANEKIGNLEESKKCLKELREK